MWISMGSLLPAVKLGKRHKIMTAGFLTDLPDFADECDNHSPLKKLPNCFITPHIAWAARESRQRLMDTAVDNLKQFLNGTPVNVVNP